MGSKKVIRVVAAMFAVATWVVAPTSAAEAAAGICVRVEVDGPMLLPDGSHHEAGTLRICERRTFTPVASLHAMYVEGAPVAMLMSRKQTSEAADYGSPTILFERDRGGRMRLLGYVLPQSGASVSYTLAKPSEPTVRSPLSEAPTIALAAR
jgi:hypothetical protein